MACRSFPITVCVLESRGGFSQPHLGVKRLFVAHFVVHFIDLISLAIRQSRSPALVVAQRLRRFFPILAASPVDPDQANSAGDLRSPLEVAQVFNVFNLRCIAGFQPAGRFDASSTTGHPLDQPRMD